MSVDTTAHGITEEPSSEAQRDALDTETVEVIPEDEVAEFESAEQGMTSEPSAKAQEAMLDE